MQNNRNNNNGGDMGKVVKIYHRGDEFTCAHCGGISNTQGYFVEYEYSPKLVCLGCEIALDIMNEYGTGPDLLC